MSKIFTDESGKKYELSEHNNGVVWKTGELFIKPLAAKTYNFSLEWREIGFTNKEVTDSAATMHAHMYTIEEAVAIQKALDAVMTYINHKTGSEREVEWKDAVGEAMSLVQERKRTEKQS